MPELNITITTVGNTTIIPIVIPTLFLLLLFLALLLDLCLQLTQEILKLSKKIYIYFFTFETVYVYYSMSFPIFLCIDILILCTLQRSRFVF